MGDATGDSVVDRAEFEDESLMACIEYDDCDTNLDVLSTVEGQSVNDAIRFRPEHLPRGGSSHAHTLTLRWRHCRGAYRGATLGIAGFDGRLDRLLLCDHQRRDRAYPNSSEARRGAGDEINRIELQTATKAGRCLGSWSRERLLRAGTEWSECRLANAAM